ncbi:quinoprotein relay system zinc metallohydrolase 1 [Sphaerotilus hippei]|uniref:Quinoprotein relay system zinc metallohydrolase 1 n=1 Tax=Sphaerotilus hippei TaxID=744406 RepID=A0A318HCX2_9BURK|nr:quinoprotein relay system zinc metallohydrolase 1 [Sphaerotilus hippei]PXW98825.1 quinoprotein relay system zinc metallohydrolase 1 [Sphaerotilus hippei]
MSERPHPRRARPRRCMALAVGLSCLVLAGPLTAQQPPGHDQPAGPRTQPARLDHGLSARPLAPGVYVVEGHNADFSPANGCNIINTAFVTTGEGVVVINTGPNRRYGEQLRALIARTTPEPIRQVLHLNLHPDYFLGNQAFADVPRLATRDTRAGMAREAAAYEDNLYRLCGDWMRGTEALLPDQAVESLGVPVPATAGRPALRRWTLGQRQFDLIELSGHTDSDLVLIERGSGTVFAGGLVFVDRIPTTPHARIPAWLDSLDRLQALLDAGPPGVLVPSHGPVEAGVGGRGIEQTRRYLRWLHGHFSQAARRGWDMGELLAADVPAEFRDWAARRTEYTRNVAHLYPRYEREALEKPPATPAGAPR